MDSEKQRSGSSRILLGSLVIVVIIVIAFLAGSFVLNKKSPTGNAEGKARDAARKAALRSYELAIKNYKQSIAGRYPVSNTCTPIQNFDNALELSNPGREPFRDSSYTTKNDTWPDFCYQSDDAGTKFIIWAKLENPDTSQTSSTPHFPAPTEYESLSYFVQSE